MRIFPPELEIGPLDGFDPKKDIFKRAELGRGLTNIVSSVPDPLVIALDGQWGSGKTTFLKMWAGELRKAGFPVIYFDAFANDYVEDAFTAVAGEIIGLLQDVKKAGTPSGTRFARQAVEAGKVLLRTGLRVSIKAGTMGALDAADLKALSGDVSSEVSQVFDKHVGALLTRRNEDKATILAFRDALAELPQVLSDAQQLASKDKKLARPLVFIIDELDRCRPVFALGVLERMKHLFAVSGVHFVLGASLTQLQNSVAVSYGPGIDAHAYLQKFIHLTVMLDRAADHRSERASKKYIELLVDRLQFRQDNNRTVELCAEYVEYIAEKDDLSLRAIERIMCTLALSLAVTDEGSLRPPAILAGLCVLKVVYPHLYRKAKRGALTFADVDSVLFVSDGKAKDEMHRMEWSRNWWRFCADPSFPSERVDQMLSNSSLWRHSIERSQIIAHVANHIIDRFIPPPP